MAKNTQQRSAKAADKREKVGEKELRHKVRPGIHQAMDRIRTRSGTEEISEVLQLAIMKMDAMTDAELVEFLKPPRHTYEITENVARKLEIAYQREAQRTCMDEES
jgi:hypothetical protein